jgi:hypothetical protein
MKYLKNYSIFESKNEKLTSKKIVNLLEVAEKDVRKKLNIDSADPIYEDKDIRKKWMKLMAKSIKEIGIDVIKDKSKKILSELNNDGYIILCLFIKLSLNIDPQNTKYYEDKVKEGEVESKIPKDKKYERPSDNDWKVFKDFLSFKY